MGHSPLSYAATAGRFAPIAGPDHYPTGKVPAELPGRTGELWWTWTESNRRHSACRADALPTELQAHKWRRLIPGNEGQMSDLIIAPRRSAKPASETRPAAALARYGETFPIDGNSKLNRFRGRDSNPHRQPFSIIAWFALFGATRWDSKRGESNANRPTIFAN